MTPYIPVAMQCTTVETQCGMTLGAYALPLLIFNSWTFDIYVLASIETPYISVKTHYRSVEMYQDANYETKTVLTVSSRNRPSITVNISQIYPLARGIDNVGMSIGYGEYDSIK